MFNKIDADDAIVEANGVYKTASVYEMDGALFLSAGGGFIRVKVNGATSHPKIKLRKLMRDGPLYQDQFGRLCVEPGEGRRKVSMRHDVTNLEIHMETTPAIEKKK